MWRLNHSLTLPSQLSKAKTPLQTGAVKCTGLLSLQPEVRGLSFREEETVIFILPPATFLRLNFKWVLSWGWGLPPFAQPMLLEWRLYFGFSAPENTESLSPLFKHMRWWFHARAGKLRRPQAIALSPPSTQQLNNNTPTKKLAKR